MPSRMTGSPWHIGYVKAKGERRHRSRCIYFISKQGCRLIGSCWGSSHCTKYKEKLDKDKVNKTRNPNETYQPQNTKPLHERQKRKPKQNAKTKPKGIKVGDTVELFDPVDNFTMKIHIVEKDKVCLEEGRISKDTPIGKAVLGKEKGDKVEIFTNEKMVYEIVGWVRQ